MSDSVLGWLFGGWSFGRSPDETNAGHERAMSFGDRTANEHTRDERTAEHETDDDHLVSQVHSGDAAALETLFRKYYGPLVRFAASYVGSFDNGEEVVADVFAWLWEHRTTWTAKAGVSAYLFHAVRNRALDVKKHRSREHRRMTMFRDAGETPGTANPSFGLMEQIEQNERTAAAFRLIAKLPERRRAILSLRWNHGLAWDEIAAVLGVTSTAVQMEHSRILARLRLALRAL